MANTVVSLQKHESWTKGGPVVSHFNDEEISRLTERTSMTIGDPATFGLWGFATGTWMTGTVIAGLLPASALTACIPVLLVFAGFGQFIAGLYAFRRTNMLAATAFCSFGAFNVTAATFFGMQAAHVIGTTGAPMVLLGFLLVSFAFIALALTFAATRTNAALVIVLGCLAIGYALTGIPHLANAATAPGWSAIETIGAWFLIASSFFAYYTGMAMVVNSTWNQTVFPLGGEA